MLKKVIIKAMAVMIAVSSSFYTSSIMENGSISNSMTVYAKEKKKVICTVDKLNVREGAGTEFPSVLVGGQKAFLVKDQDADIIGEKKGWYQIRFSFLNETVKGFVIKDYVEVKKIKPAKDKKKGKIATKQGKTSIKKIKISAKVSVDALKVREGVGVGTKQVKLGAIPLLLPKNQVLTIVGVKRDEAGKKWYQISTKISENVISGFVHGDFVILSASEKNRIPAEVVNKDGVFLYKNAGNNKDFVVNKKGKKIKILNGKKIEIIKEAEKEEGRYFQIVVKAGKEEIKGYLSTEDVLPMMEEEQKNEGKGKQEKKPEISEKTEEVEEKTEKAEKTEEEEKKERIETIEEEITAADNEFKPQKAYILKDNTELYNEASPAATVLLNPENRQPYSLKSNLEVIARKQYTRNKIKWYLITYVLTDESGKTTYGAGFVPEDKIGLTGELVGNTTGSTTSSFELSEEEFEAELTAQGFPEDYKERLRKLHKKHPNWRFEARRLPIDWEDAVEGESVQGLNLLYNTKNVAWKSLKKGAYHWESDSFVAFDGSSFVNASEKALRYFMDPRNFLDEEKIFQFELLSYNPHYHTEEGIQKLLEDSAMEGKEYALRTPSGKEERISYAETFLLAGVYSGVSPYHLATRAKHEVAGGGSFSASASGDVKEFEGIYNFYNIGANDSTLPLGAVKNGLNFAKNGRKDRKYNDKISFNQYIKLPWNNPYKAILGGAAYIGDNYISQGQNTIYLEKFNLTENSTFLHQYMSNVEGPVKEAGYIAKAYKEMEGLPLLFSIPVIENMPEVPEPMPEDEKNPNNWLSSIEVEGYDMNPNFSSAKKEGYLVKVGAKQEKVNLVAVPVNRLAKVEGAGLIKLKKTGSTVAEIIVTAENGKTRKYRITFVKES